MLLEQMLFENVGVPVPGELVRLIVALAGVAIATYYDVFNRKNIPDKFLYGFLAVAVLLNLVFFDADLLIFTMCVALFFAVVGYVFYRAGQIGGADVITMVCIVLLVPFVPSFASMPFRVPFIIPVIIFGGLLFAVYATAKFGLKILSEGGNPRVVYGLLIIPYLIFAYVYATSPLFSPTYFGIITVLLLATIFFMMYKDDINGMLAEELPVEQLEPEDVVAFELMDAELVKKLDLKRVLTEAEIEKLKQANIASIWIYTNLPPFLPFLLMGMLLAMFFSNALLFGL
ncbi:MAG: hypothetical protein QW590_01460 [Candidatus Bilamarchaeaceae archaeon]